MPRRFKAGRIKQTRSRKQTATFAKSVMGDGTHIETLPTDRLLAQERENDPVFHSQRKLGGTIDDSIPFPPTVFYWPGQYTLAATTGTTPTFTRATSATFEDFEGLIRTAESGEPRFVGARRVENLIAASEDTSGFNFGNGATNTGTTQATFDGTVNGYVFTPNITITDEGAGRSFVFSCEIRRVSGDSSAVDISILGGAMDTSELQIGPQITTSFQRFSVLNLTDASGTAINPILHCDNAAVLEITNWQLEEVTGQTNQNPSEYVSTGVGTGSELVTNTDDLEDADWTNTSSALTSGVTDPNGGATAYTFTANASNRQIYQAVALSVGKDYVSSWWMKRRTGTGAVQIWNGHGYETITITSSWAKYSLTSSDNDGSEYSAVNLVTSGDAVDIWTPSVKEASHGANVDGVQYFNTLNANTVTAGVVTEATGSAITSATTQFGDLNGGAGDYFSTPDSVANSLRQSMVIDVDLVLDEDSGGYRTIMCKGYSAPSRGWFIDESVGGQLRFYISGDGTAQVGITGTNSIPRGQRFNLKAVYDAVTTGISLLVNDVEIASNTSTGITSLYDNAGLVSVGCNPSASYDSIDGKIYSATVTKGPTPYPYVLLDGVSGTYVSAPDSAAAPISSATFIGWAAPDDWTPAAAMSLGVNKYTLSGNQRSWLVYLHTSGRLVLVTSADGATTVDSISTAATGFADSTGHWWRVTFDNSGNTTNFYTSDQPVETPQSSLVWTQLGDADLAHASAGIYNSSQQYEVGARSSGASDLFTGRQARCMVIASTDPTAAPVVDFYPQPYIQGDTNFTSVTGELWTLQGNAIATSPIDDGAKVDFNANDYVAGQTFESSGTNAELWTAHGNAKAFTPLSQAIDVDGSNDGWTSPDSAAASITGDIFLAGWGAPDDWTPSANMYVLGKYTGATEISYALGIATTGAIRVISSSDGSTAVSTNSDTATGFANGTLHGFGVALDFSANTATYYTASGADCFKPHNQVVWTQLGAPVTHTDTGIDDGTALVTIGGITNTVSSGEWTGRIMRAYAIASTDPTVQPSWDFDARALTAGVTTGTMPTGEVWTAVGNGTIEAQIPAPWDASGPFGYLAEGARTNVAVQSNSFSTTWSNNVSTETANYAVGPDGTNTAWRLIDNSAGGTGSSNLNNSATTVSTTGDNAFSVHAKSDQLTWLRMQTSHFTSGNGSTWFDLSNGSVGSTAAAHTAFIEPLGNGWYRCSIVFAAGADTTGTIYIAPADADNDSFVALDGTSSILIWGAQVEAGSFPSSYIATAAAAVTRNADTLSSSLNEVYPLTAYAETVQSVDQSSGPGNSYIFAVNENTVVNQDEFYIRTNQGPEQYQGVVYSRSAVAANIIGGSPAVGVLRTLTMAVALNDVEVYVDGVSIGSDTSAELPSAPTLMNIGISGNGGSQPYATVRNVKLFDERLTDAEVADL